MTKVEVTYLGKEPKVDSKHKKLVEYHKKFTIGHRDNWKESCTKEFKKILDKYEGIKEIRFFI